MKNSLFRSSVFCLLTSVFCLLLTCLLALLLPPASPLKPTNAILASYAVELLSLGALLAWLPGKAVDLTAYANLRAWLKSVAFSGAALAGIAAAPCHHESFKTFFALWALFAGQAATIAAAHTLLSIFISPAPALSRQLTIVAVSALVTAPFWSKELILSSSHGEEAPGQTRRLPPLDWTAAVMKLSPPMAVASAWYTESDAARAGNSSDPALAAQAGGNRLDLVHGPLTYRVWVGSYLFSSYPPILPGRQEHILAPGLAASLLLWGLPLLLMGEVALRLTIYD